MRKSAGPKVVDTGLWKISVNSAVADAVAGSPSRNAMLVGSSCGLGLHAHSAAHRWPENSC